MTKELEQDLGLWSVVAISMGAMIGSGIFILPALAFKRAGPAVILAYLVAALLVLPAALAKSEMATAMPEAGGTYIYIERGMGPLLGTVAGIGTWFSLSFKGALALVGGVPYLVLLFDLPVKPVALALAGALIVVNLLGAKQTGRLQVAIVTIMLAALAWFVASGAGDVQAGNYRPFLDGGLGGLFAASGLVFVSYAGVTKIASVAEEVEDPDRNIPLGMLGSLAVTTLLYVLIVTVIVGVVEPDAVAGTLTPVAVAAENTLGTAGVVVVVVAAVLALVSTANAGLLSSSRYPFAMSRDDLAPRRLSRVNDRLGTPVDAITLTGAVMLALIAFVPIMEIAKLASAFKILVFVLLNAAIVAFRESDVPYEPSFEMPLYPWMPMFGAVGGLALLGAMDEVAFLGAAGITAAGVLWYLVYARPRVDREGAATDALRRQVGRDVLTQTEEAMDVPGYEVLVALTDAMPEARERTLVRLAAAVAAPRDGRVVAVRFDEVPDQTPLERAAEVKTPADLRFEEQTGDLADTVDVPVEVGEIVSHDTKHALVNYADHHDTDAILVADGPGGLRGGLSGDRAWVLRHAPCQVARVDDRGLDGVEAVGLSTGPGPYDPAVVAVADAVAVAFDAAIRFRYPLEGSPEEEPSSLADYHEELASLCDAPVDGEGARADGGLASDVDLLVRGPDGGWTASCTIVTVHTPGGEPGRLRGLLERYLF